MIRSFLSAMARTVFRYNVLQGTQRQRPTVATAIVLEVATWLPYVDGTCPNDMVQGRDAVSVTTATTTQWVGEPIEIFFGANQQFMADVGATWQFCLWESTFSVRCSVSNQSDVLRHGLIVSEASSIACKLRPNQG